MNPQRERRCPNGKIILYALVMQYIKLTILRAPFGMKTKNL